MSELRRLIKEHILLEKKIGQIMTKIEVLFGFEIDRSKHASERSSRNDIEGYNEKEISNGELKYIIESCRREIAEAIATGDIKDDVAFVIKSKEKEIAIAIIPKHFGGAYWKLLITTVFRESYDLSFRVGKDQLVIWI
jgi:hypothetical protein